MARRGLLLAVSGHDHDCEHRTADGVPCVVSCGGGAPLYGVPGDCWTELAESTLHDCVVGAPALPR